MIASVIAEGKFDIDLLQRFLPSDLSSQVEFLEGGGVDGVKSMARSRAASLRKPIAVVVDSGTSDPELVRSRRMAMKEVVGSVAQQVPVGIIMAEPELEYVFFEAGGPLERLYPCISGQPMLRDLAHANTREALKKLVSDADFRKIRRQLLDEVRDEDLPALRQTKVIRELTDFLVGCQPRRVKVRVEIGPGVPAELQSLKETDGWKALLGAFFELLSSDRWAAGQVAAGSSGSVRVHLSPGRVNLRMEPSTGLPNIFVFEVEGEAVTEKMAS